MSTHDLDTYVDDRTTVQFCKVCAAEAKELPSECPGEVISVEDRALIASRELDYRHGQWVAT